MKKIIDGVSYDMTQDEIDARLAQEAEFQSSLPERTAAKVRVQRDKLLSDTDWIVIKAYERNENIPGEWEVYRQALRDITAQQGFPYSVTWPTKP